MDVYTVIVLVLNLAFTIDTAFALGAVEQNETQTSSLQMFSDLIYHKYASSSKLNISDVTRLWDNLINQPNSTSHINDIDENYENMCNKLSNNSGLCTLATKV